MDINWPDVALAAVLVLGFLGFVWLMDREGR